ncbi:MAG: hypothetical protein PHX80_05490 [Candidatus Nanoarchaeia archaeon]|nr:hypothetical protein [Candidatus Nanoarchaeia archaeon]
MHPQIEYVNYIPGSSTPARAFHNTGKIQVNLSRWNQIPDEFHKKFILGHEEGHLKGKTNNELFADNYAFFKLVGKDPFSLQRSVTALTDNLPPNSIGRDQRITAQTIRALKYDYYINKNQAALEALQKHYPWAIDKTSSFDAGTSKIDYKTIGIVAVILAFVIVGIIIIKKSK